MEIIDRLHKLILIVFLYCLSCLLSTYAIAGSPWPTFLKPSFDAGVMAGYTGGSRHGTIVNPATSISSVNSGSQDSSEIGAQMRLLFGSECNYRPFIYLNGAKSIGAPISILLGKNFPPFTATTKLAFTNNWLARLGIGGTTSWLYNTFQLSAGVAAAMLNQTLETYAGSTIFTQNKTSIRPSLMGNVTWCLCQHCLVGHRALLTAQITADSNPVINATIPSTIGPLNSRVNQAWVPRGDLIFSISLG